MVQKGYLFSLEIYVAINFLGKKTMLFLNLLNTALMKTTKVVQIDTNLAKNGAIANSHTVHA